MSDRYPRDSDNRDVGNYGYDDRTRAYGRQEPYAEPGGQRYAPQKPASSGLKFDVGPFIGGVVATAITTFIAGWVATAIVQAVYNRTGTSVFWMYGLEDPWIAGVYGALAAILAGAFMLLLFQAVPSPNTFFSWIAGLVVVAVIVLPFLAAGAITAAFGSAIVNGLMGFVIVALLSTTAAKTYHGRS
ncbi:MULTISPECIES: hypothetical protein [Nocardiaceae]|uniref:Uncharacterized membrane protein (DUF485 family) n=1 Tax=Rhodococcoides corynebacterioides TaxID=53972 RepID=A0ABS2KVG4_9NOCA|nr:MULTISPECIES: hypothetical protein [Rhodococcus]MBM7415937.1 uncharacterized membrane protein (DUF485 family) [Rhodococcus corynebacterioides]MBP1118399.1 uncharacterized membrane protein (DUF485 family) [Rhodococcus sp. PvP016]